MTLTKCVILEVFKVKMFVSKTIEKSGAKRAFKVVVRMFSLRKFLSKVIGCGHLMQVEAVVVKPIQFR